MPALTIATRSSPLALWQARWVQHTLQSYHTDLVVTLLPLSTRGDFMLDQPLSRLGGKGLFTQELESALRVQRADIAVHSMKDLPMDLPADLVIGAICQRGAVCDVLLSRAAYSLATLPHGAVVGTSSVRRESQLLHHRPDLTIKMLRGNIGTRFNKLLADEFDAIVLAAAGIERLHLGENMAVYLPTTQMLPAAGQGAIGIQCRRDDDVVLSRISCLHDVQSARHVNAERAFVRHLQGNCQVPIAALCMPQQEALVLSGLVAQRDGRLILKKTIQGHCPETLGAALAKTLLASGAEFILQHYR